MAYTFNRLVKEVSMAGRISEIVSRQREFYLSGKTLDVQFRIDALKKLQKAIKDNIKEIDDALYADLRKSGFETYMTETGMVLDELRFELAHVSRWARPKRVKTPPKAKNNIFPILIIPGSMKETEAKTPSI